MKTRHVFSTDDIGAARLPVDASRRAGMTDGSTSLVARRDIERHGIENVQTPEDQQNTSEDFGGDLKGLPAGGSSGLQAGRLALAVPPLPLDASSAIS